MVIGESLLDVRPVVGFCVRVLVSVSGCFSTHVDPFLECRVGQVGSGLTVVFEVLQAVAYQVDLDRSSVDFGCHGLAGLEGLLIFGSGVPVLFRNCEDVDVGLVRPVPACA